MTEHAKTTPAQSVQSTPIILSIRLVYWILFLEGIASVSLQMLLLRQVMPFVGASIIHTSIVIGVFLSALALGYYIGGHVTQSEYVPRLKVNLVLSMGILGVGLSTWFVGVFMLSVNDYVHPLISLTLYCLIIMGPLVVLLAQTVPLLINALNADTQAKAAGSAYAISTIGNVIGAVFTSLVILYFLGTHFAVVLNVALLFICYALLHRRFDLKVLVVAAAGMFVALIGMEFNRHSFEKNNAYADINVIHSDDNDAALLILNNSPSSRYDKDGTGWPYIEGFKARIAQKSEVAKHEISALILGAGGFTLSAGVTDNVKYHYVDIDKDLLDIAEQQIINQPINGEFTVSDGRLFLTHTMDALQAFKNGLADVIVLDMYSNHYVIPTHLASFEFHELVNSRLSEHGEVMINVIGSSSFDDEYTLRKDATIRSAYGACMTHIVSFEYDVTNLLYFCQKKQTEDVVVFSDNRTQLSVASLRRSFTY